MNQDDLDRLMSEPLFALDFRNLVGDVLDFLEFSEDNLDWQFRREKRAIDQGATLNDWPHDYIHHLEVSAEHRFEVSLPIRVRYGALLALITSIEWSVRVLAGRLSEPLKANPRGRNETVSNLEQLMARAKIEEPETISSLEALVHVRNCIAHNAGLIAGYAYANDLKRSTSVLTGIYVGRMHFLGEHVCIDRHALTPYMRTLEKLIVGLYRQAYEDRWLKS